MKKLILIIIPILMAILASCAKNTSKQTTIQEPVISVQTKILGVELGKTDISDAVSIIVKNGWQYKLFQDGNETQLSVETPVNFGNIDWDCSDFLFLGHKMYMVMFSENNCKHNKEQENKRFQSIAKRIILKYPKAIFNNKDKMIKYSDGTYSITLEIDKYGRGLILTYEINESKINKIIGSEL